ncbi:MAG TPA: hypothetical protein VJ890_08495 [Vineibacter sp.]|nr:hypothetical protein [Vineibacter sp.]
MNKPWQLSALAEFAFSRDALDHRLIVEVAGSGLQSRKPIDTV